MDDAPKIYASFWLRFLAMAVDWILITLVAVLFKITLFFVPLDTVTSLNLFIVFYVFFTFLYNTYCVYRFGATLGKRFAGIEIVKEEGKITLFETMRREGLLKPISVLFFGIGIFVMFFNPKRQTYYDKKLHLVVLVKTPLSFIKRICAFLIGFAFAIYLSTWTPFMYGVLNVKNEQMKRDIIDELTQKREIMDIMNSPEEEKFMEYYKKKNTPIKEKINELCAKRFLKIIDKKTTCTFEDLNLTALMEINKLYEDSITGFMDVQTQVENERSKRLKLGWMGYANPNKKYYFDYPKDWKIKETEYNIVLYPPQSDINLPSANIVFYLSNDAFLPEPTPEKCTSEYKQYNVNSIEGRINEDLPRIGNCFPKTGGCGLQKTVQIPIKNNVLNILVCQELWSDFEPILQTLRITK